jgi:deazaflavin-dependent oxidoreductase (nitroreductase family)
VSDEAEPPPERSRPRSAGRASARTWPPPEGVWFDVLRNSGLLTPIEHALVRYTGASLVTWRTRCGRGLAYIPTLLLTTVGRRSGALHEVALGYYVHEGRILLCGSLGGAARHPHWYLNLVAHPLAWVTVDRKRVAVDTRTATGDERVELWDFIKTRVPEYAAYERRAAGQREMPVVVATPRSPVSLRPW